MKKLFSIILILLSLQGISQTTKIFNTTYPNGLFGRKDTETVTSNNNTINEYLTSFGTWGKLPDSVRTFFSATSPIFYSSSTGVISSQQFTSTLNGYVPLSGGGTSNFLRADGSWATPTGTATGTVTSIATTSPITGGTITSTGTIACATCVVATVNPSLGVAHFAGSTQTATSSLIVNADITNATIDLTTKVTGVLPIANGGTNNGSLSVTNGATYYGDGSKLVALAPGTNGQHLILKSGLPFWGDTTAVSGSSGWGLLGNASTVAATNFLGTTDSIDLSIRTNNAIRIAVSANGGGATFSGGVTGSAPKPRILMGSYNNNSATPIASHIAYYGSGATATGVGVSASNTDYIAGSGSGHRFYGDPSATILFGIGSTGNLTLNSTSVTIGAHKVIKTGAVTTFSIANSYLHFGTTEDQANSYRTLSFGYNSGNTNFPVGIGYKQLTVNNYSNGNFFIATRELTTDIAPTEKVIVDPYGRLAVGTTSPGAGAIVDFTSTVKGFLPPRQTTTQRSAIIGSLTGSITAGGTGYPANTATPTALTGGTGTGAVATITTAAGIVTTVVIVNPGSGYTNGDVLSIGGTGSGFTWTISAIGVPQEGTTVYNTTLHTNDLHDGTRWVSQPNGLSGSATLDFGSVASLGNAKLTITVTGAADGDALFIGVPNGSMTDGLVFTAWTSATNTVTIQCYNSTLGAIDPASGTFKVFVQKN